MGMAAAHARLGYAHATAGHLGSAPASARARARREPEGHRRYTNLRKAEASFEAVPAVIKEIKADHLKTQGKCSGNKEIKRKCMLFLVKTKAKKFKSAPKSKASCLRFSGAR